MTDKVLILDTSALIGGFNPNIEDPDQYIVPQVIEEARSLSTKLKIETAISSGHINVKKPSPEAEEKIREKVKKTKDQVSDTDIQILALANELKESEKKPEIITDDYAIQNLAEVLEISYSQMAKPGITDYYEWVKKCPSCGRTYQDEEIDRCEVCGTDLSREPKE